MSVLFPEKHVPGAMLLDEFFCLFDFELDALQPDSFTLTTSLAAAGVSVVPEPGMLLLLGSGIVVLVGFRLLRKKEIQQF